MNAGRNQYAPMTGWPALRQQIALKTTALYGRAVDADTEVTVTSGATEALFAAIAAVVRSGDEVIVLDPCYDSYEPAIELNGGVAVHVPLDDRDFSVDWQRVRNALTARTRMIIVNTPHNPCGSVFTAADLDELAALTRDTGILVLSDEVHEHIVFDGAVHQSVLRHDELAARSFVVSSFGKTFHCTGWKIGYCVAPRALSEEFRKVHQYLTFCTFTPAQIALAEVLEKLPQHYLELPAFYQARREFFRDLMQGSASACWRSAAPTSRSPTIRRSATATISRSANGWSSTPASPRSRCPRSTKRPRPGSGSCASASPSPTIAARRRRAPARVTVRWRPGKSLEHEGHEGMERS